MYLISKSMKFAHLPDPGGLYDQSPIFLDEFLEIANAEAKRDEDEQKREQEKQRRESSASSRHPRPRRR